jgi:hypothetical protein
MLIWEITLILAPTPSVGAPASSEPLLLPLPRPLASIFGFLIPGSILRRPAYRHVATLHRLFASLSIAISQLAAEWGSPNDAPQRASQLATVVHGEALRELATTLQPILPHPADNDRKRAARKAIEDAVQAYPPFAGALADGLEFARRAAQKAAEEQQEGEKEGEGHDEKQKEKEEVTVAANIPLPPSRDGTPVGAAPRRRSARKASVPPS